MQTLETLMSRIVISPDQLRIVWTVLGALGTVLFLLLVRETRITLWAIGQVRPARFDLATMQTRGELQDLALLSLVIGSMTGAGLSSVWGVPLITISLLVLSEVLLVVLGIVKYARHHKLLRTVRLIRK